MEPVKKLHTTGILFHVATTVAYLKYFHLDMTALQQLHTAMSSSLVVKWIIKGESTTKEVSIGTGSKAEMVLDSHPCPELMKGD